MKLKIIFFPLILVACIVIFIAYIWPEYQSIRGALTDLNESKATLQEIMGKKSNVDKLKQSLAANRDKENEVLEFLPVSQNEEEIINGVNYLATDSAVNLSNVSFEKKAAVPVSQDEDVPSSKEALFSSEGDESTAISRKPAVRAAKVTISFAGNYENIRTFLEQIYKMEQYNSVSSISIASSEAAESEEGEEVAAAPGALSASVEADFGYMPSISIGKDYSNPIFTQTSFDFTSYNEMKNFIQEKVPVLDAGQTGRANPFLP